MFSVTLESLSGKTTRHTFVSTAVPLKLSESTPCPRTAKEANRRPENKMNLIFMLGLKQHPPEGQYNCLMRVLSWHGQRFVIAKKAGIIRQFCKNRAKAPISAEIEQIGFSGTRWTASNLHWSFGTWRAKPELGHGQSNRRRFRNHPGQIDC